MVRIADIKENPYFVPFAGIKPCKSPTSYFNTQSLRQLFDGSVGFLRVPGFVNKELAHSLGRWILHHPDRTEYGQNVADENAPGKTKYIYYQVDRVGFPRNQLIGKPPDAPEWETYFEKRNEISSGMYEITGHRHPIEKLLTILKDKWPYGAEYEKHQNRNLFSGIGRVTVPGKDSLLEKLPHVDGTWPYEKHFSANVYLYVPNTGGELEVFHKPELTAKEVGEVNSDRDFRQEGWPSTLIKPRLGDLILINTRRPHAVKTYEKGIRVSVATFIGYDSGKPLKFYS